MHESLSGLGLRRVILLKERFTIEGATVGLLNFELEGHVIHQNS